MEKKAWRPLSKNAEKKLIRSIANETKIKRGRLFNLFVQGCDTMKKNKYQHCPVSKLHSKGDNKKHSILSFGRYLLDF